LVFLILVLTLTIQLKVIDLKNYENERVYCDNVVTTFDSTAMSTLYGLIASDLIISLMDFCLLFFNRRKIRAYK
jgi:hypothetical protein